jgi:hypothetical protein
VRTFFEELTGPGEKPGVKRLAELVVKFIQGQLLDKTMSRHLNALFADAAPESAGDTNSVPVGAQEAEREQASQDLSVAS